MIREKACFALFCIVILVCIMNVLLLGWEWFLVTATVLHWRSPTVAWERTTKSELRGILVTGQPRWPPFTQNLSWQQTVMILANDTKLNNASFGIIRISNQPVLGASPGRGASRSLYNFARPCRAAVETAWAGPGRWAYSWPTVGRLNHCSYTSRTGDQRPPQHWDARESSAAINIPFPKT